MPDIVVQEVVKNPKMVVDKKSIMQQLKENTSCMEELKAMMLDIKKDIKEFKEVFKSHKCLSFQASTKEDQIQHLKQVSEAPVKGVIASHSLPTSVPEVQPSFDVIIPSQNHSSLSPDPAPFTFHISVPTQTSLLQPSAGSNKSVILPSKKHHRKSRLEAKNKKEKQAQNDQTFNQAIPLPTEVELPTGEEDEIVMFQNRAKLYRFVEKEWKDRGVGQLKLLFNTTTKKGRVLMRRDQVLKVCANHHVTPDIHLIAMNDHAWMWAANDFADEEVQLEKLCARFKTAYNACEFENAFEKIKRMVVATPVKSVEVDDISSFSVSENKVTNNDTRSKNDAVAQHTFSKPDLIPAKLSFISSQNFKPGNKTDDKNSFTVKQNSAETVKESPLFGFTFSSAAKPFLPAPTVPFSDKRFDNSSEPDAEKRKVTSLSYFGVPQISVCDASLSQQDGESKKDYSSPREQQDDYVPPFCKNAEKYDFPAGKIVCVAELPYVEPMPKEIKLKSGEEALQLLYQQRAKLYSFDLATKQWKERGIGLMKLFFDLITSRIRLLMRREQVLKVCCNHYVTKYMKLNSVYSSDRAWVWYALDYSQGKLQAVLFALKFRTVDEAQYFKAVIDYVQAILKTPEFKSVRSEFECTLISNPRRETSVKQSTIWMCVCLYLNPENLSHCGACKMEKPVEHIGDEVPSSNNSQRHLSEIYTPKFFSGSCESCYINNGANRPQCAASEYEKREKEIPPDKLVHLMNFKNDLCCDISSLDCVEKSANKPNPTAMDPPKHKSEKLKHGADCWECKKCCVRNNSCSALLNNAAEDKCIVCNNKRPSTVNITFGELEQKMKPSVSVTHCDCKMCKMFDIGNKNYTGLLSYTTEDYGIPKPVNPLWEMFKARTDTWECTLCFVRNNNHSAICVCCGTANPKATTIGGKQQIEETLQSNCDTSSQSCDFQMNSVFGKNEVECASGLEIESGTKQVVNTSSSAPCVRNNIDDKPFKFSSGTDIPVFHFGAKSSDEPPQKVEAEEVQIVGEVQATIEEQQEAERLMLPPNFYLYRSKPSCAGCCGCESDTDHEVASEKHMEEGNSVIASTLEDLSHSNSTVSETALVTKVTSSVTSSAVFDTTVSSCVLSDNVVSDLLSVASSTSLVASSSIPATQSYYSTSAFQEVSSSKAPSCSANSKTVQHSIVVGNTAEFNPGVGSAGDRGECIQSQKSGGCGSSVGVVSSSTNACVTTIPSVFTSTEVFVPRTNTMTSSNASVCRHACGSAAIGPSLPKKSTAIPLFSIPDLGSVKSEKQSSDECNSSSFCIPLLNVKKTTFSTSMPKWSDGLSKSLSNTQTTEPSVEDNGNMKGGRQLAFTWEGPTTSLLGGLAASSDTPNNKKADVEQEVGDNSPTPHEPFFKPAVILPDVVEVRTGEEDELRVFGERAKLYRFETTTKEWKERGVGMMKILWHPVKNTYRLLQRREQVHNVICNQLITTDLELKPIKFSNTSLCWGALNHVQDTEPQIEKLAIRFRSPIIKEMFKVTFEECQAKIRRLKLVKGEGSSQSEATRLLSCKCRPTLLSDLMPHQDGKADNKGDEAYSEEADDEAEEEYDSYGDDSELGVVFEKDDVLLLKEEGGQSVQVGMTRITIEFDDRCHLGHIYALQKNDDRPISDICIDDSCTVTIEGSVCEWKGLDKSAETSSFSTFSADMMCASDVDDFRNAVELCGKMRQNPENYSDT